MFLLAKTGWVKKRFVYIQLFSLLRIPEYAEEDGRNGVHDRVILRLVLKHLGEPFLALGVGHLRGLSEEGGELVLLEYLRIGASGNLAEFFVLDQAVQEVSDDNAVAFREIAVIDFVDCGNNLIQQAPFRFGLR